VDRSLNTKLQSDNSNNGNPKAEGDINTTSKEQPKLKLKWTIFLDPTLFETGFSQIISELTYLCGHPQSDFLQIALQIYDAIP